MEGLKRFSVKKSGSGLFYRDGDYEIDNTIQFIIETVEMKLNQLSDENEQLKQYKQSVNDVLRSWSQKNLTAKQLQVVLAIMEELNIIGDVE